jgi:hypothetical protein
MTKRGKPALTICSTAFQTLGRAQASALGKKDLPIAVMPHPFGVRKRVRLPKNASMTLSLW